MRIPFHKMQGLGNDFVVIDQTRHQIELSPVQIKALADRHFGIGFDQLLLIMPATQAEADYAYRIFNADGGEVEQCGNGARCIAKFAYEQGICDRLQQVAESPAGLVYPQVNSDGSVTVDMGKPIWQPQKIPFNAPQEQTTYAVKLGEARQELGAVSMGNPHAVVTLADIDAKQIGVLAHAIAAHTSFPQGVNVGFMQVLNTGHIKLRVFERGAGETLACGSGACAAVAVGKRQGLLAGEVEVDLPGGRLQVAWLDDDSSILLTGPAETVFSGEVDI